MPEEAAITERPDLKNPDLKNPAQPVNTKSSPTPKSPPQRIVLTGFMGAGKSTVGRLLAQELDWRFIDVDDEIESASGATIAQIFRMQGEPRFRELEHQTILQLAHQNHLVLGLGGGAIEDDRTRALLLSSEGTRLVHLQASLETVRIRCRGTETIRPILADSLNLEARYERRLPLYRLAHHTVAVDHLTPEAAVHFLRKELGLQELSL